MTEIRTKLHKAIEHFRFRIILFSIATGIFSGIAAIALLLGLEWMSGLCQGTLMGVARPHADGEHVRAITEISETVRPWLIFLLPGLGGLLSGVLVYRFAPEAEGHGMDAMIRAFHREEGRSRVRVPFVKAIASVLTIGSGGSGGREGPIAQIGAGLGSWIATKLGMSTHERRIFMLAGAAGGIGAIFRAPLGGAISSVEILYREDFESSAVLPCIVSSVTAYTLFRWFIAMPFIGISEATMYRFPELSLTLHNDLVYYVVLAVFCAIIGRFYVVVFHGVRKMLFPKLPLPRILRPCLGGLMVGLIGVFAHATLGAGHGYLQEAIDIAANDDTTFRLMGGFLMLAMLKIITTSLTIGSGGSGGVFGPSLLIGGLLGAGVGCFFQLYPIFNLAAPPVAAFVVIGMAGVFAGVANAPIGSVIIVSEMTGSYSLLAPLLMVCVLNLIINQRFSLYEMQMENRFESPAHKCRLIVDVMAKLRVADHLDAQPLDAVSATWTNDYFRVWVASERAVFPLIVLDDTGQPAGMLTLENASSLLMEERKQTIQPFTTRLAVCKTDDTLASVMDKMTASQCLRLPVIEPTSKRFVGHIGLNHLLAAYQRQVEIHAAED